MNRNEFVWVESYRPQTIDDCILPDGIKKNTFKQFVEKGGCLLFFCLDLLDVVRPLLAKALCHELQGRLLCHQRIRWTIPGYCQKQCENFKADRLASSNAKHKVIIIDEADNTTPDVQLCLRNLLRSLLGTVDSSSPVTTKTKSSTPPLPML